MTFFEFFILFYIQFFLVSYAKKMRGKNLKQKQEEEKYNLLKSKNNQNELVMSTVRNSRLTTLNSKNTENNLENISEHEKEALAILDFESKRRQIWDTNSISVEQILCFCYRINCLGNVLKWPEIIFDNVCYFLIIMTFFITSNYPILMLTCISLIY